MLTHPFLLLAAVLTAALATPPTLPAEIEASGHRALELTCSLLEGDSQVLGALTHSLEEGAAALDRCPTAAALVRVQWSWGGDKGATVVVTRAPDPALADCVEAALSPQIADIVGYCVATLPLEPAPTAATAASE